MVGLLGTSGCVYFNAVYNANRLFKEGRQDIANGRVASGESTLGSSIRKAERVVADNPDSRWADDALRLIVRARILRREWPEALARSEELMTYAESRRDSAEVAGYAGLAEAHSDRPARADSLLSFALEETRDEELRAWFLHGRGHARALLERIDLADADFQAAAELRPDWLRPRMDRVEMLVDAARHAEAVEALRGLLRHDIEDFEERETLETARYLAEAAPAAGIDALAVVEESRLSADSRSQLVKMRGDLHATLGQVGQAATDYRIASSIAPRSPSSLAAEMALLRMGFDDLASIADIYQVKAQIDQMLRVRGGRSIAELTRLRDLFERMVFWVETGNLGYLLAGEAARDELGAPRLARTLFVRYADEQPQSAWSPKALLAALELGDLGSGVDTAPDQPLTPAALRQRLTENYPDSPYLKAVTRSDTSSRFTYEDLEQGLQRQLERLERLTDDRLRERRSQGGRR